MRPLLAALLLLSCSPISSSADVTLDGTLTRQDQSPAASLRTALVRLPDPLELITQGVAVIGTLGLACLDDSTLPICKTVQHSTTDGDGRFRYMMKGSDVKGSLGQVSLFQLAANLGSSAPSVQVNSFSFNKEELTIPTARFWEPATVTASVTASQATVGFDRFSTSHGHEPKNGYQLRFTADAGGQVWSQNGNTGSSFDARALEDAYGAFSVSANDDLEEFHVSFRSKAVAWSAGGNPAPLSRGRPCLISAQSGAVDAGAPCPYSNGRFDDAFVAQPSCAADAGACASNRFVQIDLGAFLPVNAVFAHGLRAAGKVAIETSADGIVWAEVTRVDDAGEYMAFNIPAATFARHVRLTGLENGISALNELSVW